VGTTPYVVPP